MSPRADFQLPQADTSRVGVIAQWLDDKGYGWVEVAGKRFFAHINDFERGQSRPRAGEEVRFTPGVDPKGRACAKQVTLLNNAGFVRAARRRMGVGAWLVLAVALPLPLLALLWLPLPWWMAASGMLGMSAIAYG